MHIERSFTLAKKVFDIMGVNTFLLLALASYVVAFHSHTCMHAILLAIFSNKLTDFSFQKA